MLRCTRVRRVCRGCISGVMPAATRRRGSADRVLTSAPSSSAASSMMVSHLASDSRRVIRISGMVLLNNRDLQRITIDRSNCVTLTGSRLSIGLPPASFTVAWLRAHYGWSKCAFRVPQPVAMLASLVVFGTTACRRGRCHGAAFGRLRAGAQTTEAGARLALLIIFWCVGAVAKSPSTKNAFRSPSGRATTLAGSPRKASSPPLNRFWDHLFRLARHNRWAGSAAAIEPSTQPKMLSASCWLQPRLV